MDTQTDSGNIEEQLPPETEPRDTDDTRAAVRTSYHSRIVWENYLRCFFLTAVVFLAGFLAWRPGMLRFSLILSLANPSRGESLAWAPEEEPPAYFPEFKRVASPDEWRLQPAFAAQWGGNRPRARQDDHVGGSLSPSRWRRFSTNPWRWSDDTRSLRAHGPNKDLEALPGQKPATDFRAGDLASWPETASPGGTNGGLSAPVLQGVQPLLPSQTESRGVGLPTPPPAAPSSLPALPDLPPPLSVQATGGTPAAQSPAVRLPSTPQPEAAAPAASAMPSARPESVLPETPEENPEEIDWKNREITGPIPNAYLTIYPKLKFVGLCVPGHGYIRKYNQVGVPRESEGTKMSAQDGRTPYGKYYIADRRRDSDGPRLYLSWPSPDDARRIGMDTGKLSEVDNAWRRKELPPQNTPAGGGVGLNGLRNWVETTDGGFTLEAPHMEEIYTAIPDGAWVFVPE